MSGRAIIIIVMGIIIVSSIIILNIEASSTNITANFNNYYLRQSAQDIAQSGVNMGLRQLVYNGAWRTGFPLMNLLYGKVIVSAFDTTFAGTPVVAVRATGTAAYGTQLATSATSTAYVPKRLPPPPLKGVLATSGPTATAGSLVIDGRNHTTTGTLVPGQGVYGIWTSSTFSQGGGSTVGGTVNGTDYAPKGWPKSSKVIQMNVPTSNPGTPDSVFGGSNFGYPEGTLKSIAQSAIGGSQYVTDPTALKYPLVGVTYVEVPSGSSWSPNVPLSGTGIIVVHNSAKNAILVNVSNGNFAGIIIGDDIIHLNNTVIGAIIALTPNPSQGNVIGNGNGQILYSSPAIKAATDFLQTGGLGSSGNVLAWRE